MFKNLIFWLAALIVLVPLRGQPVQMFQICESRAQVQSIPLPTDRIIALVVANNSPSQLEIYRYYSQSTASADGDGTLAPTDTQFAGKWLRLSTSTASGSGGGGGVVTTTTSYGSTVTLNLSTNSDQWITLAGNMTLAATGHAASKFCTVRIDADSSDRTILLPSSWRFMSGAATNTLYATKIALLTIKSFGTSDTNVVASWISE